MSKRDFYYTAQYTEGGRTHTEYGHRIRATSAAQAKTEACRLHGYSLEEILAIHTSKAESLEHGRALARRSLGLR